MPMLVRSDLRARFAAALPLFLLGCISPAAAEPVRLPAGMSVQLELQHHVSSSYTPAGSPIYFRVAKDVVLDGHTLIARDTLVTGRMQQAKERGMIGKSGAMLLEVDTVPAVDGTSVAVEAEVDKQGRSRAGAAAGWTLFWGLPGLLTHGVNPYMEKGSQLVATVRVDQFIDPANAIPVPQGPELGLAAEVTQHQWEGGHRNSIKKFDIERKTNLKTVAFTLALPAGIEDPRASLASLQLLEVERVPVAEETRAISVGKGAAIFDGWAIARYCHDGPNTLLFGGADPAGRRFHASYVLRFEVKKKG